MSVDTVAVVEVQTIVAVVPVTPVVTVTAPGPQGPPGLTGPMGPIGGSPFTYTRDTPAATWPINHELGRYPQVTVVDQFGSRRISDVVYADINNVSVIHSEPLVGAAYLS
jgi:hypothetical protein